MTELRLENFSFRAIRTDDGLALEVTLLQFIRKNSHRLEAVAGRSRIALHFPPQHFAEETHVFQEGSPNEPVPSHFQVEASGKTELSFEVPGAGALTQIDPISLSSIIQMCQQGTLASSTDAVHGTRIELPTRLLIAISPASGWSLRPSPTPYRGRHELWTARPARSAAILPIGSRDDGEDRNFTDHTPLRVDHRHGIVASTTKPLPVRDLAFSSQGAWLDIDATFEPKKDIAAWIHKTTMGRDQFVRVVERGFLYPTGHRAIYVTVTRRRIAEIAAPHAYLEKRYYVQLEDKHMAFSYPHESESHTGTDRVSAASRAARQLAMRSLDVLEQSSPALDAEERDLIHPRSEFARWVRVGGRHYHFPMKAMDTDGEPIEFGVPVIFVHEKRNDADLSNVERLYREDTTASNWRLGDQRMSLAPAEVDSRGRAKRTAARVSIEKITIAGPQLPKLDGAPNFHAVIVQARANLPEVERVISPATNIAGDELMCVVENQAKDEWNHFAGGLALVNGLSSEIEAASKALERLQSAPAGLRERVDQALAAVREAIAPDNLHLLPMTEAMTFGERAEAALGRAHDRAIEAVNVAAPNAEALALIAKAPCTIEASIHQFVIAQRAMVNRANAMAPMNRLADLRLMVTAFDFTETVDSFRTLESMVAEQYRTHVQAAISGLENERQQLHQQLQEWQVWLERLERELTTALTLSINECLQERDRIRRVITSFFRAVPEQIAQRVQGALARMTPLRSLEGLLGLDDSDLYRLRAALTAGRSTVESAERSARAAAREIESLVGAAKGIVIQHPTEFLEHGFRELNNPKQIFAILTSQIPVGFDTSKLGGLCEPNVLIKALARELGPMAGEIFAKEFDPATFFPVDAKILGVVPLREILKTIANVRDNIKRIPGLRVEGNTAIYTWETHELKEAGPFRPFRASGGTANLMIEVRVSPQGQYSSVSLANFGLVLWNLIEIDFSKIGIQASGGGPPHVDVDIADVRLGGQLAFFQDIQKSLQTLTGVPGLSIRLLPQGVLCASIGVAIPNIGCGMFALQDMRLTTEVDLSMRGSPIVARFRLGDKDAPFTLSIALLAGGGFIQIEVAPNGVRSLAAALEFGASLAFSVGVAEGRVYAMGGVYLELKNGRSLVTGYLRIGGNIRVLGIISVSIVFYLALIYGDKKLAGVARVTVNAKIGFFSIRVEMEVYRELVGSKSTLALSAPADDPTVEKMMSFAQFIAYRRAFAS